MTFGGDADLDFLLVLGVSLSLSFISGHGFLVVVSGFEFRQRGGEIGGRLALGWVEAWLAVGQRVDEVGLWQLGNELAWWRRKKMSKRG